jgi:hypothetical protein
MILRITNNVTKKTYDLPISDVSYDRLYLNGTITLEGLMDEGEYNYFLLDNDNENKVLAVGILQIGDYVQEDKITYDTTSSDDGFIQYNG